jgi:hypothetical protein
MPMVVSPQVAMESTVSSIIVSGIVAQKKNFTKVNSDLS